MQAFSNRLLANQPLRYIFIGGVSYAVELIVLLSLANLLLLSPELSVACSFWIGLIVSFLLQKYIAFGNSVSDKKTVGKQTTLYGLLVLFNYSFTIAFVGIFTDLLGLFVARTAALLLTTIWNYLAYKKLIFN